MKILNIRAMKGPNYWSIRRHKLIVMRLDLEDMEEKPTNVIPGFLDRLRALMPSMYEHRCSEAVKGGFFMRVEEGTWMGHVIEHIALEIQTLAGMDTGFGRTRSTEDHGVYNVVFSYIEEKAGRYAAEVSVDIAQKLADDKEIDLEPIIQKLREIREDERLGPSTASIVREAVNRGIPYMRLNPYSLVQLGYGKNQKRIQATVAGSTSNIAVEIACDKEDTKYLLDQMNIPIPKGDIVYCERGLKAALKRLDYPLVIKPVGGNHGRGATIGITNEDEAYEAMELAKKVSRGVIVEEFIEGFDHRLLVVNYQFVSAAKRTPAKVVGDGKSTVQELVDEVNKDPRRGYGHEKVLTAIKIDKDSEDILKERELTLESVLPEGEILYLKRTANLSTGGTAEDVTDYVHPFNVFTAERIARIVGLDICGIDIMTPDIGIPLTENKGRVLEVNAAPGFRMHLAPTEGIARNVAAPVVDMLFPPGSDALIPIIAITGTNGKTTTTRLMAHLAKNIGYKVGFTTSDGIYIQNRMLEKGDCTGPSSTKFVLMDPTVDFAVLECARGGMLRAGLGFPHCDIGIVTNIASDHLGMRDIHTLEDLARVKGVVVESVKKDGYAILNADDDLVYGMGDNLECNIAYFSMVEDNPRIQDHLDDNGVAAVLENGYITIMRGHWKLRLAKAINIPLTFGGKAVFNIQNILPTVLAGYLRGWKVEDLRRGLETFIPSPTVTPGRMNIFQFKNFEVIVDYAHNPAGMRALGRYLERVDNQLKVGIVAAAGDRRDEDIVELGEVSAELFDEIIIRLDKHLRGRDADDIIDLIVQGIRKVDENVPVKVIKSEREALGYAIENAKDGSLVAVCSDGVTEALNVVMKYKEEEEKFQFSPEDIPNQIVEKTT